MRLSIVAITCLLLGSGCINLEPSADPTRYFIMKGSEWTADEGGYAVEVISVSLEPYLASPRMVVRLDENEVRFSDVNRWAEPLEDNIRSVLSDYIAVSSIGRVSNKTPGEARLAVRVHINRFEGRLPDQARMVATWSIEDALGNTLVKRRSEHVVSGWGGADYQQLTSLLESTLEMLAQEMAAAL